MKQLILVNKQDQVLGKAGWQACHSVTGLLHRGFTVLLLNDKNELLIAQRSKKKPLWPSYWDGACSSHPAPGESFVQAGQRRLKEELGFSCQVRFLFKFNYQAVFKNLGSEHEVCAILLGRTDKDKLAVNPDEVAAYQWLSLDQLKKMIKKQPNIFCPWFKKIIVFTQLKEMLDD